jgi:magnesium transporter
VISVRVTDDQEVVAQELARYDFLAIPVVDDQNQLVGIVTHDDILDVIREEATEDAQRMGGMQSLDDSYLTTPILTLTWKRGMWLVLLLCAAMGTATVLKRYEPISQKYDWLIWFIPMVMASGGNAGSQSATLIIRTLALGELRPRQALRIAGRELLLAAQLGLGVAAFAFCLTLFFVTLHQAVVVASTVILAIIFGAVTGAMLPLGFKRLGMDPAIMSNPLIASIVDVMGVVIYYNVALLLLD